MAQYRVASWEEIPIGVEAFDGAERVRRPLSPRFQELIDALAMRRGVIETAAYLEGWRVGDVQSRAGSPREVAEAVAAELEGRFEEIQALAQGRRPEPPGG